jgi:hypothetical protein
MKLSVGQALYSTVDSTAVIVVRAPQDDVTLTCGDAEMTTDKPEAAPDAPPPGQQDGTLLGKRYADEDLGLELLCTKAGTAALAVNGAALAIKQAKPLPASD